MPGCNVDSEACRRQGFLFRQVYAALRFSRGKNKAGILDVYWDCGFLGVKDGIILPDLKSVREILEDAGKPRVKLPGMEIESAKEQGNGSNM